MKQQIRFCRSSEDVRIAYATAGDGPPLVKVANWLSHLEFDWDSPVWCHWLTELARHHTLVRYDQRGCGLSDWDVAHFSLDAWVDDLEAVVNALSLDRFPLLGLSRGAAVSVAYAARHPERVSHLLLYGGYARGRFHRSHGASADEEAQALLTLIRVGWGQDNPAFRQIYTTLFVPEGTGEQVHWFNELQRISTSPANAARMAATAYRLDVSDLARQVLAPALVLHAREDAVVPFEQGRQLAALIPNARFVPLESKNHILLADEAAWPRFLAEVRAFLQAGVGEPEPGEPRQLFPELTPRECEVLELVARGFSNHEIAESLVVAPKTVRNYISRIFSKLGVERRAQAIVLAREAGLGRDPSTSH